MDEDSGQYTVRAENSYGKCEIKFNLAVQSLSVVIMRPMIIHNSMIIA